MTYKKADHFSRRAQKEGYAARSVYKLQEMQQKWKFLKPGQRVVDLGCAPGSWSRFAQEQIGFGGVLVGIDIQEVAGYPGQFLQQSIEDTEVDPMRQLLGGDADVVISDMAPSTTGNRFTDHVRQIALIESGLHLALQLLRPGGSFVAKVFEGQDAQAFVQSLRSEFGSVKRFKPKATRGRSVEFFVAGMERKP
ncbi:MAG: RlmE family RNA methyltransferase [Myxococcota bacterium]|nr:RlmE family RNA methyltransferase [Myxococcota bacterium]